MDSLKDVSYNQDEQRLLVMVVEQVAEAIILTDPDGNILYVNPAFERLTGYSRHEALRENPRILKSGIQDDAFYEALWKQLKSGQVWHGRLSNRKKDGDIYTADVTISAVRDSSGAITNFVGVQRDITRECELESQLNQAQKLEAVGSLAAGIAHEINTPIQFVGGNTEFLHEAFDEITTLVTSIADVLKTITPDEERERVLKEFASLREKCDFDYYLEETEKAISQTLEGVQRVSSIVRAMKDFSHPDQGEFAKADVNDIIGTTLTVSRNEYKYVADVELDLDPSLPEIDCLQNELHQVFLNMIVNAAHAIESKLSKTDETKGLITIKTHREDERVVISLSDDGCGIKKEHCEHIFEQFFTTKEVGRGTGQGLALSRALIVERHQGTIDFESEEGVGTTFLIRLPITQQSPAPQAGNRKSSDESREGTC